MTYKPLSAIADTFTVQIVNGSVLVYFKNYTFDQIQLVILNLQASSPEEWLLWATLVFTLVQTIYLLIQIARLLHRYSTKLYKKLKLIYVKVAQKYFRG